jgi:hypothetical protein
MKIFPSSSSKSNFTILLPAHDNHTAPIFKVEHDSYLVPDMHVAFVLRFVSSSN